MPALLMITNIAGIFKHEFYRAGLQMSIYGTRFENLRRFFTIIHTKISYFAEPKHFPRHEKNLYYPYAISMFKRNHICTSEKNRRGKQLLFEMGSEI
jgi:hypothetical protein